MELVRSNALDVARSIAPARAWASRNWHTLGFACTANLLALLIAFAVSLGVSVRAAAWLSLPVLLALNGYVLWRAQASRRRWVVVGCADRLYVRLFAWRSGNHGEVLDQDVLVLEASEIASMSARTVEVFLDGPKPKMVEWLVIELAQAVAADVFDHIRPLLTPLGPGKAVLAANEEGRITIEWKWWRPALRGFLQEVLRECPSVVIGREERSELDVNAIWKGIWRKPDQEQRRMLVQAKRLGFGCECAELLGRHRQMSFQKATGYLEEIEREETETGHSAVPR
jgi:hypothetical protein